MAVMVMIMVIMVMMLVMFLIMVLIMMLVGIRRMFSITLETMLMPPVPIMSSTFPFKLGAGPNPAPTTVVPGPIRLIVDFLRYLSRQLYNDLLCLQGDAPEVSQKGQTNYKPFHRFTENLKSKKSNEIAGRIRACASSRTAIAAHSFQVLQTRPMPDFLKKSSRGERCTRWRFCSGDPQNAAVSR
jgi:hypothetical protein